jgi:hypothetical protein
MEVNMANQEVCTCVDCLRVVRNNGIMLQFMEEQTEELCLAAVEQNGGALQYVKHRHFKFVLGQLVVGMVPSNTSKQNILLKSNTMKFVWPHQFMEICLNM